MPPKQLFYMKQLLSITLLCLSLLLIACSENQKKLPILGAREPISKVVDGKTVIDTLYKTIPDFNFLNQDSLPLTEKNFDGSVYVADFFFTSCPSICPIMHRNMLTIYEKFKGNDQVKFLSHSIDFKYDTPSALKAYQQKLGISGNQWQFASGTKEGIYGISKDYMVFAEENGQVPGGYEHQGWFILVDKEKRIRGAYDGTDEKQVAQLIKDIPTLLKEYAN